MATRHHCDVCDKLVRETISNQPTRGIGIRLHVQFFYGAEGDDAELCASCARAFLPLMPARFRLAWERAIVATAAGEDWTDGERPARE